MTRAQRLNHLRLVSERTWPLGDQAAHLARPTGSRGWLIVIALTVLLAVWGVA